MAWAAATGYYFAHWIQIGQADPVKKHFPKAVFSEYETSIGGGPRYCVPSTSGFMAGNETAPTAASSPMGKRYALPGGAQSPEFYFDISTGLAKTLKEDFGVEKYPLTAFNAARHAVNHLRSNLLGGAALGVEVGAMVPYIPYKSYKNSKTNSSDHYQEVSSAKISRAVSPFYCEHSAQFV